MKKFTAFLCIAVLAAGLLIFVDWQGAKPSTGALGPQPSEGNGASASGATPAMPAGDGARALVPAPTESASPVLLPLRLLVREQGTLRPLMAKVVMSWADAGSSLVVTRYTDDQGQLEFTDASAGLAALELSAEGFEVQHCPSECLREPGVEGLIVEMLPSQVARVRVVDSNGTCLPDFPLLWQSVTEQGQAHEGSRAVERSTDSAGEAELRCSSAQWVTRSVTRGQVSAGVLAFPGGDQQTLVVLEDELTLIFLESESGIPVAGLDLQGQVAGAGGLRRTAIRTDAQGSVTLTGIAGTVSVRAEAQDGLRFRPEQPNARVFSAHRGLGISIEPDPTAAGPRTVEVLVDVCGGRVLCLDQRTEMPIRGTVDVRCDYGLGSGDWLGVAPLNRQLEEGVFRFSCGIVNMSRQDTIRMRLEPDGYQPEFVNGIDILSVIESGSGPLVVRFRRGLASQQRRLIVLDDSGAPFRGVVHLREAESGASVMSGAPGPEGELGTVHWYGGDLIVAVQSGFGALSGAGSDGITRTVTRESLELSDCVTVQLPLGSHQLSVVECPALHEPLVARRECGTDFFPARKLDSRIEFLGLPTGHYLVGPRVWVDWCWQQRFLSKGGAWIELQEAREHRMTWRPEWASEQELRGRVEVAGALDNEPILVPVYGPVEAQVPLGWSLARLEWRSDGSYVIPVGSPVPTTILVCVAELPTSERPFRFQTVRVLGSLQAGEDLLLSTSSVLLTWPEGMSWDGPVLVTFQLPVERLRTPDARTAAWGGKAGGFVRWCFPSDFLVHGLIGEEVELSFQSRGGSWKETVVLRSGQALVHKVTPSFAGGASLQSK